MSETGRHWHATVDFAKPLHVFMLNRPDAYVGSDMFMYFREGDPSAVVSPDVFVAFGAPKEPLRDTWKLWEEGVAPAFVLEVTSKSTRDEIAILDRMDADAYLQAWEVNTGGVQAESATSRFWTLSRPCPWSRSRARCGGLCGVGAIRSCADGQAAVGTMDVLYTSETREGALAERRFHLFQGQSSKVNGLRAKLH